MLNGDEDTLEGPKDGLGPDVEEEEDNRLPPFVIAVGDAKDEDEAEDGDAYARSRFDSENTGWGLV